MIQPVNRSTYVPHIDGLRAVAVLAVIVYHLNEHWLPGGLCGVDIFFVISGFVVSASLAEFRKSTAPAFFAYFYARRMLRILPALVVCLLVTHVFAMWFIPYAWLSDANQQTGLYAFFGLSNYILADTHFSYFAPRTEFNPYTHTWSLGVEEQFYLIFPPLFAAWIAGGRGRAFSSAVFALGLVASLICAIWLSRTNPDFAFYMLYGRFWELSAGVLLYQLFVFSGHAFSEANRPATVLSQAGAIASAALVAAGLALAEPQSLPFPGALMPVLGTLGLLASLYGREQRGAVMRLLRVPAIVFIGQISYSLYLWHWPVFVLLRWTIGIESVGARILAVALTFLLATASYFFIERPPRRMPRLRAAPRWAVIACGAMLIATSYSVATQINVHTAQWSLTRVGRDMGEWYPGRLDGVGKRNCALQGRGEPVGTSMVAIWSGANCDQTLPSLPRLFVIGDSHAEAYSTLLMLYAMDTGGEVYKYSNGGCPFISLQLQREGNCAQYSGAAVADILRRARKNDILFLPSLRLDRLTDQNQQRGEAAAWLAPRSAPDVEMRRRAVEEAVIALKPFAEHGVRIVFEAPTPLLRVPPFRCLDWFNANNPVCAPGLEMQRSQLLRYREPVLQAFAQIAKRVDGVTVWDPFPSLCPDETCTATRDGHPLYYDGDHLSGYANRLLAPEFEHWIEQLIGHGTLASRE